MFLARMAFGMVCVAAMVAAGCGSSLEDKADVGAADVAPESEGADAAVDGLGEDVVPLETVDPGELQAELDQPVEVVEEEYTPLLDLYPPAPYGKVVGSIIRNHKFLDPQHSKSRKLSSIYNPDGTKDKTVLIMNASAGWCSVCKAEAIELKKEYATYKDQGLEIWFTLFEDYEGKPATVGFWSKWIASIKADYPTLLDTAFELGEYFSVEATPLNMVIDLKTMKIVYMQTGFDKVGMENSFKQYLKD